MRGTILVRRFEGVGLTAGRVAREGLGAVHRVRRGRVVERREDVRVVPFVVPGVRRVGRDAAVRRVGVVREGGGDGGRSVVVAFGGGGIGLGVVALDVLRERRLAAEPARLRFDLATFLSSGEKGRTHVLPHPDALHLYGRFPVLAKEKTQSQHAFLRIQGRRGKLTEPADASRENSNR